MYNKNKNNMAFLKGYRQGKIDTIKFMIENDLVTDYAHVDSYNNSIFHYVAANNDDGFLNYLLQRIRNDPEIRSYLNIVNKTGDTPLHTAIRKNSKRIIQIFINNGADINKCNKDGSTPLHIAAENKDHVLSDFLIKNGANSSIRNNNGEYITIYDKTEDYRATEFDEQYMRKEIEKLNNSLEMTEELFKIFEARDRMN